MTARREDALLAQVMRRETPAAFRAAPSAERAWRARLILMTLVLSRHEVYAWCIALADDVDGETRRLVESIDDAAIVSGLRLVTHD